MIKTQAFSLSSTALILSLLGGVIAVQPTTSHAATATANASVTILAPVTITKTADLIFGSVAPTTSAGTVVMSAAGARTGTNVTLSSTATGNAAAFNLSGDANSTFSVTLPSSTTLTGPGSSMTVNAFTSSPSSTGTFNGSGAATLTVGATLAVGANQAAGSYTGTFSVTVDYN